jgi:hypothetical protein
LSPAIHLIISSSHYLTTSPSHQSTKVPKYLFTPATATMFSKLPLLGLVSLIAAPLAVNAGCTFNFFTSSDCSGGAVGYCNSDYTVTDECYWNTWTGSIYWDCDDQTSPSFVGCVGDTEYDNCANAWSISVPADANGCQVIGTYDGEIQVYLNNDRNCPDCIGGDP